MCVNILPGFKISKNIVLVSINQNTVFKGLFEIVFLEEKQDKQIKTRYEMFLDIAKKPVY